MRVRMNGIKKETKITLLFLAAYFTIPIIVNLPYLISGKVMAAGDGTAWLNIRSLFAYGFQSGDPALWNPYGMLGAPFMADIQSGFFYPLNYLALIMPLNVFGNVYYICTLTMAGFFMYLFMTEMQKSRLIAFLTGLVFMFSTILGGARVAHQNVYSSIIWLPLVLYFIQRYIRTNNRKELFFSAVAMALQFFAGFPQVAIYSDIFVFLYLIVFMEKSKKTLKKRLLDMLVWLGIYVMLIAIQLLPLAELIRDSGRNSVSYGFFASYSADYKVLPMTIFPELFGNIYEPFGAYHTTGVDIEIYLGIIPLIFLLFALLRYLKDKKIRTFIIFDIISLFYCMIGNIPVLGELVWKIPVLGSFRVAARMLFVYIFFTVAIFGMIIEKLRDRDEAKRLLKLCLGSFAVLLLIMIVVKALAATQMASEEMRKYFSGISIFSPTILITLGLSGIMASYCYIKFVYQKRHVFSVIALLICAISIADVCRYSLKHGSIDYYTSMESPTFSDMKYIEEQDNNDQYRSIAAIATPEQLNDPNKMIEFKANGGMLYRLKTFNAYLTFESQKVKSFLGFDDTLIMSNINYIVHSNQSQLSAASIKYLVDPYHDISENEQVITGLGDEFLNLQDVNIASNNEAVNVQNNKADIAENQQYFIQFKATTQESPTIFYVDLYGLNYDLSESTASFNLQPGTSSYNGILNTGNGTIPDETYLRIVSQSDSDIQISDFKVYKVQSVPFDSVYKTLLNDGSTTIYENVNARPIINTAENVEDISQYNTLQVNTTSFIESPKTETLGNNAQVDILEIKNDSIKAKITSEEEVFINHTQAMYPGWNAYVDGVKVQDYLVNKTYQGAYVPAGEHILEFRFEPLSLYIGAIVTAAGIALIVILIRRKNVKKVNLKRTNI